MNDTLLDINVLLALAWPNHQFHGSARRWFAVHDAGWCTCAVTQLGFVRLSSNPAFTDQAKLPAEAAEMLKMMMRHPRHRFIPTHVGFDAPEVEAVTSRMLGHKQVTDGYLIALALDQDVKLASFDRRLEALAPTRGVVQLLSP